MGLGFCLEEVGRVEDSTFKRNTMQEGVAKHTSIMKKASTFPSGGFVISVKFSNFTVQNY